MSRLDLLTANDTLGEYPATHYARNLVKRALPTLKGDARASVCVIGAGFTGLNVALSLAKLGVDVIVLEASRIGFGASGRNGGQIGTGQRADQLELEAKYGFDQAKAMFEIGVKAHDFVKDICDAHAIDIGYQPGVAHVEFSSKGTGENHRYVDHLAQKYGYENIEKLDKSNVQKSINSEAYQGGSIDWGAGHGDPLALALGMAEAAIQLGVQIFENARVHSLEGGAKTEFGRVAADHYVIACNGYLCELDPQIAKYVMPINNFIISTKVLGAERAIDLMPQNIAVADSKFVVNYFRRTPDHRLLFGGGESYGYRFPRDITAKALVPMTKIFPQLKHMKIENAWGGTLAITRSRLPYVRRSGNIWTSCGYSGHGVALASYIGHLMGQAIFEGSQEFDLMASLPHKPFPGGVGLRHPLLIGAMLWYQLRDRLGV